MQDNWFSLTGSGELLESLARIIWYRKEERARLRGEAMAAEGRGYQEMLRAADMATTVEQNRLALIQKKAEMLRAAGMGEEGIALMSQGEIAKLERVGRDIDVLRRRMEHGDIPEAQFKNPRDIENQ